MQSFKFDLNQKVKVHDTNAKGSKLVDGKILARSIDKNGVHSYQVAIKPKRGEISNHSWVCESLISPHTN